MNKINKNEEESNDSSSGISDYQESENDDSEEVSFENNLKNLTGAFAREELDLDGLQIDFDSDEFTNQDIIKQYETEVHYSGIPFKIEEKNEIDNHLNEATEIITDQKLAEENTVLLLKHEMMGNLLNVASLKIELREADKLKKINDILELKEKLLNIVDLSLIHI